MDLCDFYQQNYNPESISGNEWYELQCVKLLNQILGRGIRNRYDFCTSFIIDERLENTSFSIRKKLSKWIQDSFENGLKVVKFNELIALMKKFWK